MKKLELKDCQTEAALYEYSKQNDKIDWWVVLFWFFAVVFCFSVLYGCGSAMTFPRALQIRRLAKDLPFESLVLETDAPDIPPAWLAHQVHHRNEPSELPQISSVLAEIRSSLITQTQSVCSSNALRVIPRWAELVQTSQSLNLQQ